MTESQKWLTLFGALAVGGLLYLLAPVLTPFLLAAILAYIGDPVADRLEASGFSRTMSVVTVFVSITVVGLALLFVLVPMLEHQIALLLKKLPGYLDWLQNTLLPALQQRFGLEGTGFDLAALREMAKGHWREAGGAVAGVLASVSRSGASILTWIANLVLVPVVTFYLLRDWDVLMGRIRELIPRRVEPAVVRLVQASDEVLGAFLRGQLTVMAALGFIYTVGLWVVGLDLALLIGMLAGVVSFVPYLGFIVGILVAGVAAVMQFHEFLPLLYVFAVFGVGQVVEGMILQPLLLGERIGLHPVAVIFAVLAGGQLFGFFGVLLALPVAAVVAVLLRYAHEQYLRSQIYESAGGGE